MTESGLLLRDTTIANVSATRHGFVPKHPNDANQYLRGDGTWATLVGGTGAVPTWVSASPDTPPGSPNANDHEFTTGDTVGGTTLGSPGTAPVIQNNRLVVTGGTSSGFDVKGQVWTAPSTPYTVTAKIRLRNLSNEFHVAGVMLRSSASQRFMSSDIYRAAADERNTQVQASRYTSLTTRASVAAGPTWSQLYAYLRITDNGTNIICEVSEDGYADTFETLLTEARGTHFTSSQFPDQFGVFMDSLNGSVAGKAFVEWLRVT